MTTRRSLLKVVIHIETPWRIGTGAGITGETLNYVVDPRPARDADRHPKAFVPATALIGSLRRHLTAFDGTQPDAAERVRQWLGMDIDEATTPKSQHGTPTGQGGEQAPARREQPGRDTLVTALGPGSVSADGDGPVHGIRRSTAVDPSSRAAVDGTLRSVQIVEATAEHPSVVSWFLEVPGAAEDFETALASWRPFIGAGRSVGWGRGRVATVERIDLDLAHPQDLTWWLTARAGWFDGEEPGRHVTTTAGTGAPEKALIDVSVTVEDALHVGTGERVGAAKDTAKPLDLVVDGDGNPIVPGSSLKGLFRARIERILRLAAWEPAAVQEMVAGLFGPERGKFEDEKRAGRGALRFEDLTFPKAKTVDRHHVAIDRFTGGARDGALFAVRAVARGASGRVRIYADRELTPPERNLLHWVLKDLHDGMVGIGGMSGRGYGTVRIDPVPEPEPVSARPSEQTEVMA